MSCLLWPQGHSLTPQYRTAGREKRRRWGKAISIEGKTGLGEGQEEEQGTKLDLCLSSDLTSWAAIQKFLVFLILRVDGVSWLLHPSGERVREVDAE